MSLTKVIRNIKMKNMQKLESEIVVTLEKIVSTFYGKLRFMCILRTLELLYRKYYELRTCGKIYLSSRRKLVYPVKGYNQTSELR